MIFGKMQKEKQEEIEKKTIKNTEQIILIEKPNIIKFNQK